MSWISGLLLGLAIGAIIIGAIAEQIIQNPRARISIWLSRFLPARLRRREVLDREARELLWEKVGENDPCLRAVLDLESEMLEAEFHVLVNPQSTAEHVAQARAGLRKAFYTLQAIEDERAAALEARQAREGKTKLGKQKSES